MQKRDMQALVATYSYAGGLIGVAEVIRHWRQYPQDFTRKIVHVGAGMWVFGTMRLFETWSIGIIPFSTFIPLNYAAYRQRLFKSIDTTQSTPGTVYFAASITMLFLLLWRKNQPTDRGHIAAAATMAMTWGDSLASIVGRRWGYHRYRVGDMSRSWEGSAAMLVASTMAMALTLRLVPGSALSPTTTAQSWSSCLVAASLASLAATLVESRSPAGTDNLTVPLVASLTLLAWYTANSDHDEPEDPTINLVS